MGIECAYSFWDLYRAAFGKDASRKTKAKFYSMSQNMRNREVESWAKLANWQIDKRLGTDGEIYFAFAPSFRHGS